MSNVKIVNAQIFKLDPDAAYLIGLDNRMVTEETAQKLLLKLKDMGIKNGVALMTVGDPTKGIKIIKQEQADGSR